MQRAHHPLLALLPEFLDASEKLRAEEGQPKTGRRMSWFQQRRLGRNLDKLEDAMNSVRRELGRDYQGRAGAAKIALKRCIIIQNGHGFIPG
jgi:hypothetical protein